MLNDLLALNKSSLPNQLFFLAPEIINYKSYNHKHKVVTLTESVDMWALGCVLYNMLTGVPPHYSESFEEFC
jgi:serine/threonine protein kinase